MNQVGKDAGVLSDGDQPEPVPLAAGFHQTEPHPQGERLSAISIERLISAHFHLCAMLPSAEIVKARSPADKVVWCMSWQNGAWDDVSGETFLRTLLSMPVQAAKFKTVRMLDGA